MTLGASLTPPRFAVRHAWLAVAAVLPLLLLLAIVWPFTHLVWTDRPAYSHGYLVLGIAGWLTYRVARKDALAPLAPSWLGAAALALVVILVAAGAAADVALAPQLAVPALPLAALWAVGGARVLRPFIVPCGYMIFALPVWDVLNEPLRRLTIVVAEASTRAASIPAFIEGDVIRIPAGSFVVEGGCSGLHFLIVACALGTLYGLLNYEGWLARSLTLLVAAAAAMVANWVRVFVVIAAGHLTNMQHYLVTVDHYLFGWALFFVFLVLLLLVARRFESAAPSVVHRPVLAGGSDKTSTVLVRGTVACAIVLWGGVWLATQAMSRPVAATASTVELDSPATLGSWQAFGDWEPVSRPRFDGADIAASGSYRSQGDESSVVDVYIAHYGVQRQGKEAVFYANVVVGGELAVLERGPVTVQSLEGGLPMTELEVGGESEPRRIVWYGYRVAGRTTRSAVTAKLYQALGALGGRWDAQVLVASARCATADCTAARHSLGRFLSAAEPALRTFVEAHSRNPA
jgi:EpsI family protein